MTSLYDLFRDYLNHSRTCAKCGDRFWVSYSDGHVMDVCLSCPSKQITLQELASGCSLDMPGYITEYPVPTEPMPDWMDFRRYEPVKFLNGREVDGYKTFEYNGNQCEQIYKTHEGYYRMKD